MLLLLLLQAYAHCIKSLDPVYLLEELRLHRKLVPAL